MRILATLIAVFLLLLSRPASALILTLPQSLAQDTLSETVPTAFAPNDLDVEDFTLEWAGPPVPHLEASLLPGTLQWVRVADVLALPRARLSLRAVPAASSAGRPVIEGGRVVSAGGTQAFVAPGEDGTLAEIPVALIGGAHNGLDVTARIGGAEVSGRLQLRYKPRPQFADRPVISFDPSCSRFGLKAETSGKSPQWMEIGCRLVGVEGKDHRTSSLELLVFWEGAGDSVEVGGASTSPTIPSLWLLRQRSQPGEVQLSSGSGESRTTLHYGAAENLHYGSLGVGLGPYSFHFDDRAGTVDLPAALLTLYGSYFVTEALRIVAFDATTMNQQLITDFGLYLNTEQFRTLDRRISLNIMLGAHVIGFNTEGVYEVHPGFPQGFEVIFTDAFGPARNLSVGGFIYPNINDKAYYNLWLRYGQGSWLVELNYISWREPVGNSSVFSRSVGVSVGLPLARFF